MKIPIFQVDAFTHKPYRGNPAAVVILQRAKDSRWLQKVAAEMNLSETAFLWSEKDGFRLRWFTPMVEVDLCGHATLASAFVLWETKHLRVNQPARFFTRSGLLVATLQNRWIMMDFPAEPAAPADPPPELIEALKVKPVFVGRNRFDYLLEVESADIVKNLQPDFNLLAKVKTRGVMVTAKAQTPAYDFVSRFFAPAVGVQEDPVTGSAHCCLGPYWAARLNKKKLKGYQVSTRGGLVKVEVKDSRVLIGGQAVMIFRGELLV
ncbi:MAG: PhzF family phenazine biosynthesis protein [Candidatus Aminicenantes bacterium]|nr:PhzF family phenazine biosynthesis protein [Candidatus Aminicenantes bacterium]